MGNELNNPPGSRQASLLASLQAHPLPVIVEFWAAWCAPCRAMESGLLRTGEEFKGKVDLWRINADEHPEILHALKVYGIPTMILFQNGQELARRAGAQSPADLMAFFRAAEAGEAPPARSLTPVERFLRAGSGLAGLFVAYQGGFEGFSLALAIASGVLIFSAVYDRCPIWKAVSSRVREWLVGSESEAGQPQKSS
ncbi:MAG TPA: thioredoxin domain-containing protein [Anaerolineales bacterium]|nr:thioredoxin domain-containing protein [Anaerolineales bacterium]